MRKELFDELMASVREMKAIRRGDMKGKVTTAKDLGMAEVDASAIRAQLKVSQAKFAALLGVSVRTLQGWEQKQRTPAGPARQLLRVAQKNPKALLELAG